MLLPFKISNYLKDTKTAVPHRWNTFGKFTPKAAIIAIVEEQTSCRAR